MDFDQYWKEAKDFTGYDSKNAAKRAWDYQLALRSDLEKDNSRLRKVIEVCAKELERVYDKYPNTLCRTAF